MSPILASSEGWKSTGPRPIQRRTPPLKCPMNGTSTPTSRQTTPAAEQPGPAPVEAVVDAVDEGEGRGADHRPHQLAHEEVVLRLVLAHRDERARAVDHDDPEDDEHDHRQHEPEVRQRLPGMDSGASGLSRGSCRQRLRVAAGSSAHEQMPVPYTLPRLEVAAALGVARVLVEARAAPARAAPRRRAGQRGRAAARPRPSPRRPRSARCRRAPRRSSPGPRRAARARAPARAPAGPGRVAAALVLAAEDQHHLARHPGERARRGADVRRPWSRRTSARRRPRARTRCGAAGRGRSGRPRARASASSRRAGPAP